MVFSGRDLDVVSTALIIDIVDNNTDYTVLPMPYNIVSFNVYIIRGIGMYFKVGML